MAKRNVKMTIRYDGAAYHGWQRQLDHLITVQKVLEEAIENIVGHPVNVLGSGRTDSGVHAMGQVANVRVDTPIPSERLYRVITRDLPEDIRVIKTVDVPDDFDAISSSRGKLYRYTVFNNYEKPPQAGNFCYQYYHNCDIPKMQQAAAMLIGEHDFASFTSAGSKVATTVRTLYSCHVFRKYNFIYFDVEGSGFLYHMVRNIVGTLLDVGRGNLTPEQVQEILIARDRQVAGPMAPARGLCLQWVRY